MRSILKLSDMGEDRVVKHLLQTLGRPAANVVVGPGDDCAAVRRGGVYELLKTDCIVEQVHFLRNQPPRWVGWKALCRAISDIGAMGGLPKEALVTVAAPADLEFRYLRGIFAGIAQAAGEFAVTVVGGETSRSPGPLFISIALTGEVERKRMVLRSGGRPGDFLYVTGELGGSGRGKHLRFTPRVKEARWLTEHFPIHAMMDLSDGLGKDLPRLAAASGTGYELDLDRIPVSRAAAGVDAAVGDGEDYELLLAVSPRIAPRLLEAWEKQFKLKLTCVGRLCAGRRTSKVADGFDHFT